MVKDHERIVEKEEIGGKKNHHEQVALPPRVAIVLPRRKADDPEARPLFLEHIRLLIRQLLQAAVAIERPRRKAEDPEIRPLLLELIRLLMRGEVVAIGRLKRKQDDPEMLQLLLLALILLLIQQTATELEKKGVMTTVLLRI